jgi:hypothetical protein
MPGRAIQDFGLDNVDSTRRVAQGTFARARPVAAPTAAALATATITAIAIAIAIAAAAVVGGVGGQ